MSEQTAQLKRELEELRRELDSYRVATARVGSHLAEISRLNQELRRFQHETEVILNTTSDAIRLVNPDYSVRWVNPAMAKLLGTTPAQAAGRKCYQGFTTPFCRNEDCLLRRVLDSGKSIVEETTVRTDNREIPCIMAANPLRDEEGNILGILEDLMDISEYHRARVEIAKREKHYRRLFNISPTSFLIEDARGRIVDVNPAFSRIFGYRRDEVIGKSVEMLSASADPELIREHIKRILGGEQLRHIVRNRCRSGEERYLDLSETRILLEDDSEGILAAANDITEQVRAAQAREKSESRLSAILSSMTDLVFAFDADQRFTFFHSPNPESLHLPPEQFMGKKHEEVFSPEMNEIFQEAFARARAGKPHFYEYCLDRDKVGRRWFSCKLSPIQSDGKFAGAVGVVTEITERKRFQEEMLRHSLVYRQIEEAVLVFDRKGRFLDLNPAAERLTGWSRADLIGRAAEIINPPEQATLISRTILDGLGEDGIWRGELPILTKEGETRTVSSAISCLRNDRGETIGTIGINRDITESKRMEAELLRGQKLESLGVLAGGLAHDFNNLLMRILANTSLIRDRTSPENRDLLLEVERACQQAKKLTQQLLTFARGGAPAKQVIEVGKLLREEAAFALRGSKSTCEFEIPAGLHPLEADPGQLAQVIHNLVINASQAMPGGGTVRIATENATFPKDNAENLPPGDYVRIQVADEGPGIPEEAISKVFDPFFTNKLQGSGLGLTISYSIVSKHEGRIRVDSPPSGGCRVEMLLPASGGGKPVLTPPPGPPARGRGRILVFDDDRAVRTITCRMLTTLGYRAEAVPEGGEAVRLYREARASNDPFDAVIADLTIPGGMGGKEALPLLKKIDPAVRVIVASGYSNDPVMADYASFGFRGMLGKPYNLEQLGQELARILNKPS